MLLLDDIIEKRKVKLYRKNFQTLENMLESWKKNLENDLPLSSTELKSFSSFRIDVFVTSITHDFTATGYPMKSLT